MHVDVEVSSPVARSARVTQVEGLFDVPPSERTVIKWSVDMPIESRDWHVGLIVGPSGSGKSTVARRVFPNEMARTESVMQDWAPGKSLLDGFPKSMGVKDIVQLLSSVGFSSPPAWVRPFEVLSNGEKFRVSMARVLAEAGARPAMASGQIFEARENISVVDEFTSVVDRTVAQVGSHALARTVRARNQRFVAVTCHEDVEAWLQPDWIYRPADQSFAWRSVQPRPRLEIRILRVHHSAWRYFKQHHYLTDELNKAAVCFAAFVHFPGMGERLACFDSWLPFFGQIGRSSVRPKRSHRVVCLPDYQGIGIGHKVNTYLASMWKGLGFRPTLATSHPGFIAQRRRDPLWTMYRAPRFSPADKMARMNETRASDRLMAGFEYLGPAMDKTQAETLHNMKAVLI